MLLSISRLARHSPIRLLASLLLSCMLAGLIAIAIGLIPCNRNFKETEDGIKIFVYSDSVHSEFVFPCITDSFDWTEKFDNRYFQESSLAHQYVGVGWGEKDFFIETPGWNDIKLSTTARAMFLPTASAVKVTFQNKPEEGPSVRSVKISKQQYKKLVKYVLETLAVDGKIRYIRGASHGTHSRFFEANGSYQMFWTCNAWVGQGLKQAGIKVGCYTPLPKTVFWWF